jgi:hypothetical protein
VGRLAALRDRNFRIVFAGQAISSFGNSLVPVALAFAVLRDTGSATDLGYVLGSEEVAVLSAGPGPGRPSPRSERSGLSSGVPV